MEQSSKKEWYKSGWGIVIAILFLPIFIVWYVWAKTKWFIAWKLIISIIIGIMFISAMANSNSTPSTPTPKPSSTTAPVVNFVFDVPSLVGKNIDEIRQVLGAPADKELTEPTQQQLSLGMKEWDNTFEKDGKALLVTYDAKSRKVVDFFISTDDPSGKTKDKKHLLEMGNVKDGNPEYRIEFVKTLIDPNYYTGVKIIPTN